MTILAVLFASGQVNSRNSVKVMRMVESIKDDYYYTFYFGKDGTFQFVEPTAAPTPVAATGTDIWFFFVFFFMVIRDISILFSKR